MTALQSLPRQPERLVLRGGSVETRDALGRVESDVLIERGVISALLPRGAAVDGLELDCSGRVVHPGLADAHCHLPDDGADALLLLHGITAVRDMWGSPFSLRWRDDVAAGRRAGPRVIAASPLLESALPTGPRYPGLEPVTSPADAATRAAAYEAAGYDQLKVYSALDLPTLSAVGRATDLPVTGHCPTGLTWEQALEAGMRHFEHLVEVQAGRLRGDAGVPRATLSLTERVRAWSDDEDPDAVRRLGDRLVAGGAVVCPTLGVWGRLDRTAREVPEQHLLNVPAAARARWNRGALSTELRAAVRRQQELVAGTAALLAGQGVPYTVGTDAGSIWTVTGFSYAEELELLADAGLPEVLHAATAGAADAWGQPDRWGRVRPGLDADLLVLPDDPRNDVTAATRPDLVLVGGRIATRAVLVDAVAARAEHVDILATLPDEQVGPMATRAWWAR